MSFGMQIGVTLCQDRPWLLLLGTLLVGDVLAWQEIGFGVRGRVTDAVVTKSQVEKFPAMYESIPRRVVRFEYTDELGRSRNGREDVDPERSIAVGDTVSIQYLPGVHGASRLTRGPRWWAVGCLAGTLVVAAIFGIRMHRLAHEPLTWRGRRVRRPPVYRFE